MDKLIRIDGKPKNILFIDMDTLGNLQAFSDYFGKMLFEIGLDFIMENGLEVHFQNRVGTHKYFKLMMQGID